jgi:peptidoglycan/LPS O-acetylase OafA/YrhL
MLPDEFDRFGRSLIAVNLFVSNILFALQTGYFAPEAELEPMLHTWSLAVEEQFYLVFPLLLLALRGLGRNRLTLVIAGLCALSLAATQTVALKGVGTNFYLPVGRAWELGAGALLALSAARWSKVSGAAAEVGAGLGLGLILAGIFLYERDTPFPSLWTLTPVLGASAVIAFARPETLTGRLLCSRPMIGIGMISYSAYLWHQPIIAFARLRLPHDPDPLMLSAIALTSLPLAWATWRWVERPFRIPAAKGGWTRAGIFRGAGAGAAAMIAFGIFAVVSDGAPGRFSPAVSRAAAGIDDISPRREFCSQAGRSGEPIDAPRCLFNGEAPRLAVLWGDSHGVELAWQFATPAFGRGYALREITRAGCLPVIGMSRNGARNGCARHNENVLQALAAQSPSMGGPLDLVVLTGRWALNVEGSRFANGEGGVEHGHAGASYPIGAPDADAAARADALAARLHEQIDALTSRGVRVVLVYPAPEVGWQTPSLLARRMLAGLGDDLSTDAGVFAARTARARAALDAVGEMPGLTRVRPETLFCGAEAPEGVAGRCMAARDGVAFYFDDDHPSGAGAALMAAQIADALNRTGWAR